MTIAALVIWTGSQTWNWTRHITQRKVIILFVLFYTALLALITQEYNPFIYFIF